MFNNYHCLEKAPNSLLPDYRSVKNLTVVHYTHTQYNLCIVNAIVLISHFFIIIIHFEKIIFDLLMT